MNDEERILIVDDEPLVRDTMAAWLIEDGCAVDTAASGAEALERVREREYALCFIDLKMPGGMDGIATMAEIRKLRPAASAVIITAYATVDSAVTAMKEGAEDYIVKPCNLHHVSLLVQRVFKVRRLERSNRELKKKLLRQYEFHDIISKSPRMMEIAALIRDVADLRSTVLIQGESGTGKEMIARAIHQEGSRKGRPFVAVPCSALSETLLESELFGYERGAFTGALSRRHGKVEMARGGTLFLDEIGDISPKMQMDLLRFLQERTFFRVGGTEEVEIDVRVVAATHRDLVAAVREGTFRQDLFYRLAVIGILLPPLRERREDIPLLARHFLGRMAEEVGKAVEGIDAEALRILVAHDWPGNVRELENTIERACVTSSQPILGARDFGFLREMPTVAQGWDPPSRLTLAEIEEEAIKARLRSQGGNVSRTAETLGIDRSTLYEKLKRYGLRRPFVEEEPVA